MKTRLFANFTTSKKSFLCRKYLLVLIFWSSAMSYHLLYRDQKHEHGFALPLTSISSQN